METVEFVAFETFVENSLKELEKKYSNFITKNSLSDEIKEVVKSR